MNEQTTLEFPRAASAEDLGPAVLRRLTRGRRGARRAQDLAAELGTSERNIRAAVEQLRKNGALIGSASADPAGFFLIDSMGELEQTAHHMRSRALGMLTTVAAMKRAAEIRWGDAGARLFDLEDVG